MVYYICNKIDGINSQLQVLKAYTRFPEYKIENELRYPLRIAIIFSLALPTAIDNKNTSNCYLH